MLSPIKYDERYKMLKLKLYEWIYKATLILTTILVYQLLVEETESLLRVFTLACITYTISTVTEHFYKKTLCESEHMLKTIGVEQ